MAYEKESGLNHNQLFGKPNQETGEIEEYKATFLPELSLHLEEKGGQLYESKDSRYFQVGKDIQTEDLNWRGMIDVVPTSILAPSEELEKQRISEVFNLLVPLLQLAPQLVFKPSKQLLKANDQDPEDWLPDAWLALENKTTPQLFVDKPIAGITPEGTETTPTNPNNAETIQAQTGTAPNEGGQTVVPENQIQPAGQKSGLLGAIKGAFGMK
jgi:hypothetical protein